MPDLSAAARLAPLPPSTETDHLLELRDGLRRIVSWARDLARLPLQGQTYDDFRTELKRCEFLCGLVVYDRADGRWSTIPLVLGQIHKQAGDWLRSSTPRERFMMLAEMIEALERYVDGLRTQRTGRRGAIWKKPLRHDRTEGRPVQVLAGERMTGGGVIVPA